MKIDTQGGPWRMLAGVGGIGTGMFFALEGEHTLGRNESRPGRLLDVRDYCKLHIIAHYVAVLLGARESGEPFHVVPIGKVGRDDAGRRLLDEMNAAGMDTRYVEAVADRATDLSVCFQYPDGSGGNITTSNGASSTLAAADIDRAEDIFAAYKGRFVALAAPEAPLGARKHLLELAGRYEGYRVAAFASAEIAEAVKIGIFELADLVSLNEDEAGMLVGRKFKAGGEEEFLADCARALTRHNAGMRIVMSAGKEGAYGYEGGKWDYCPSAGAKVASTAGAGDALLGGVIAGLAAGRSLTTGGARRTRLNERPLTSALDMGVILAGMKVTSPHTIHPGANAQSLGEFAAGLGVEIG